MCDPSYSLEETVVFCDAVTSNLSILSRICCSKSTAVVSIAFPTMVKTKQFFLLLLLEQLQNHKIQVEREVVLELLP